MKIISNNSSKYLDDCVTLYRRYMAAYDCKFQMIMAIQFEINELEVLEITGDSNADDLRSLKVYRNVLTRIDNTATLKLVA